VTTLADSPPLAVLHHFAPHASSLSWLRAGGGFSGALVWRGDEGSVPRAALKGWPPGTTLERVRQVHAWLARAAHLPFVPTAFAGIDGRTALASADRVWECCRWQLGGPRAAPSVAETEAACEAVAELHLAWSGEAVRGPCPGVLNRLRILAEAEPLLRAGLDALPPMSAKLAALLRRAAAVAARAAQVVARELRPWAREAFALQPCVRDLRGEHVLFHENRVVGIVDYGAAAVDSPAADLARLFIDYDGAGGELLANGLAAYRQVRAFDAPDAFVRVLIRSGAVCSVLGWLVRVAIRREPVPDVALAAARLGHLVALAEKV
jgi:homoserine kinase type II